MATSIYLLCLQDGIMLVDNSKRERESATGAITIIGSGTCN